MAYRVRTCAECKGTWIENEGGGLTENQEMEGDVRYEIKRHWEETVGTSYFCSLACIQKHIFGYGSDTNQK